MTTLCQQCGKRPATYRVSGQRKRKADKQHDLCRQCFRSACDASNVKQKYQASTPLVGKEKSEP